MTDVFPKSMVQTGYGDSSVFEIERTRVRTPAAREVRIRHTAIGVNFHDIYVRTGLYRTLTVPAVPGIEAVGEIVEVGNEVTTWRVGQRVAYIDRSYGAYCEERVIDESLLLDPPADLPDAVVATSLLRGLTAAMLLEQVYKLANGELCLIHAVSGSTGAILVPWAKHLGARVVGTAGKRPVSDDTAALCERIYSYSDIDWSERVLQDYGPQFDYVCDSVGAPTLEGSLSIAASCGHIALFGQSGGMIENIPVRALAAKSLTVTRPSVFDYVAGHERRPAMMRSFTSMVEKGVLKLPDPICLPLDQAGEAQRILEDRLTSAPVALIP